MWDMMSHMIGFMVEWTVLSTPFFFPFSSYPDHNLVLHVLHDVLPLLWLLRRLLGDQLLQVAGLDVGRDAAVADVLHVVHDVVHHLAAARPELWPVHVAVVVVAPLAAASPARILFE